MDELTPRGRAAAQLIRDKDAIARQVTDALYRERPALLERHGPTGRDRCLEDIRYTVEHLVPAVDLDQAALFTGYVRWLDDLLRARGVATDDVQRSLTLIGDAVRERFAADEAAAVAPHLAAGVALLVEGRAA